MKLWVDDLLDPPETDWTWVQTSKAARWYLNIWINDSIGVDGLTVSLGHVLGSGSDTTRSVVLWLIDNQVLPWIDEVCVHTTDPASREWLKDMIARYLTPDRSKDGV